MADLHILIDSATKHTSRTNKYGESIAAWGAWWSNNKKGTPVKAGIHYFRNAGPNKVFYQGVIGALERNMGMCWPGSDIVVFGDCGIANGHAVLDLASVSLPCTQLNARFRPIADLQTNDFFGNPSKLVSS